MQELLDAIIHLCDALLIPFTKRASPRQKWVIITGTLIAFTGMVALAGVAIVALLHHL